MRTLLGHMGDGRRLLVVGFGFIVVDALAQISAPAVFRSVLNRIQTDPQRFVAGGWRGPALTAGLLAAGFVASAYVAHTASRRGAARWSSHLRRTLYEHVQRLSLDFFGRHHVGAVAARINQDIERLELAVANGLSVVWASVMLVAAVAFLAWVDLWLGLLAVGLFAVAAAWTALVLPRLRRRSRAVRDDIGATSGTLAELLGLNPLIKAFNAEDEATGLVAADADRVRRRTEDLARLQFRYADLLQLHVNFVAPFVLLFAGAWRAAGGSLLLGDVVAVWAFWQRGAAALTGILNNVPELFAGLAAGERVAELYRELPSVPDEPDAPALAVERGAVRFEAVSFAYPSRPHHTVLDRLDLSIGGGERVALVGPSGSGKSTVAQLLLRFHDPERGRVLVDGQDLRRVRQASLRACVGAVFQDNVLLSGSLARNLRLARPDASEEDMWAALEAAHASEFVRQWDGGLDAEVGERGVMMSGGQRQRLAIARVMLKDPAIVVLDEATSALDAQSEQLVLAALERLLTGRTSLVIAHRMATVRGADRIVVIGGGRIEAEGDHETLLRTSPTYRAYCEEQSVA